MNGTLQRVLTQSFRLVLRVTPSIRFLRGGGSHRCLARIKLRVHPLGLLLLLAQSIPVNYPLVLRDLRAQTHRLLHQGDQPLTVLDPQAAQDVLVCQQPGVILRFQRFQGLQVAGWVVDGLSISHRSRGCIGTQLQVVARMHHTVMQLVDRRLGLFHILRRAGGGGADLLQAGSGSF